MSKLKVAELADEIDTLFIKYGANRWLLREAILQVIDRENILTGNRIRKRHGEPEKIPEINRYKQRTGSWVIDVPREWYSETGKDVS